MRTFELLAAGAVLFGMALLAGWGLLRITTFARRRSRVHSTPPLEWRPLIADRVPLTAGLTEEEWQRLLELVVRFLETKQFEGSGGLVVSQEMRLAIAAQACLLILNLEAGCYPLVHAIVLHPGTFVSQLPALDHRLYTTPVPEPMPLLGQHVRGVVVLAWDNVRQSTETPGDGNNVVLHEFAHELDIENGDVDGVPLLEAPSSTREWARVLQRRFEELRHAAETGQRGLLNLYGATNRAEFFAVATEAFFERPVDLLRDAPDLYAELKGFYRQDPALRISSAS